MSTRRQTTAPPVAEAIAALQRLSELFTRRRDQLARDARLTVPQWEILERIAGDDFMPSMFAREAESSAPAVSRTIRQLLDKGLVTVGVSSGDGRVRTYSLTTDGRQVLDNLHAARARAVRAVWCGFETAQLGRFVQFSNDLIGRLEAYASRPAGSNGKAHHG